MPMTIEQLNIACKDTLMEQLGIEFISWDMNELVLSMPVLIKAQG